VSTTARDADRLGYDVLIAEDCVGDRDIPGASGEEVTKMVMHELGVRLIILPSGEMFDG